jgi:hypothetical protein
MVLAHIHELRNERAEEHQLINLVLLELYQITKTPENKGLLGSDWLVNYLDDAIFPLVVS